MSFNKTWQLRSLHPYRPIHSISLFWYKEINAFCNFIFSRDKLIRALGFTHFVWRGFLATFAEIYKVLSFSIFLLRSLHPYRPIHSISLFWYKEINAFCNFIFSRDKLIRALGFTHFVWRGFLATFAEIYKVLSFSIFLLRFPYILFQETLRIFWDLSIYNHWGFINDNNVVFYVLDGQPFTEPFTGKGH